MAEVVRDLKVSNLEAVDNMWVNGALFSKQKVISVTKNTTLNAEETNSLVTVNLGTIDITITLPPCNATNAGIKFNFIVNTFTKNLIIKTNDTPATFIKGIVLLSTDSPPETNVVSVSGSTLTLTAPGVATRLSVICDGIHYYVLDDSSDKIMALT
tara:strand:+ start:2599 stop:3066 length:468 start_codon:yes stop_codon:yes gene_type:complete